MSLDWLPGVPRTAGRIRHPKRLAAPDGYQRCEHTEDLHYHWQSAWGDNASFLGNEPIAVRLFNGGYTLETVELRVQGTDADGETVFDIVVPLSELPRGKEVNIEVPTYEVTRSPTSVTVTLASAEFGSGD